MKKENIDLDALPLPTKQLDKGGELRFPIKRFLSVFVLLTFGSLIAIVIYTGNPTFLLSGLRRLWSHPWALAAITGLLLLEWYTDYLRYYSLARGLDMSLPMRFGLKLVFANLFFAYLTPGGAFGAPVIIYMMVKRGEKLSRAIAIAMIKPFLLFFLLLICGSVLFWFADFALSPTTAKLLWTSSIAIAALTLLVAAIIFQPAVARQFSDQIFRRLRRWRNKRGHKETPRLDRAEHGLDATIEAFSLFGKNKLRYLLGALLFTAINLLIFLGISVVLLQALEFPITIKKSWLYSFLYYFLIAFAPTPGGSGLAEGGGYLFFKGLGTLSQVSSYIVLWRFLSCYLVIIIGAGLFFRFIQKLRIAELQHPETTQDDAPQTDEPLLDTTLPQEQQPLPSQTSGDPAHDSDDSLSSTPPQ